MAGTLAITLRFQPTSAKPLNDQLVIVPNPIFILTRNIVLTKECSANTAGIFFSKPVRSIKRPLTSAISTYRTVIVSPIKWQLHKIFKNSPDVDKLQTHAHSFPGQSGFKNFPSL